MIIWCGGESIDFPNGTPLLANSSVGRMRAGYARCALYCSQNMGALAKAYSNPIMEATTFPLWMSAQAYLSDITTDAGKGYLLGICDANQDGFYLKKNPYVQIVKRVGGVDTVLAEDLNHAGLALSGYAIVKLDMHITGCGPDSTIEVYARGAANPFLSYTGDTSIAGVGVLNVVATGGGYTGDFIGLSEFIVATTDTRVMSLVTLAPNAAGDANAWTGAYTDVNEITTNDATALYTDATDQDVQLNLLNLPAGSFTVKAVKVAARAVKSVGAVAGSIALGIKSGGTVSPGESMACNTVWETKERFMEQNPVTLNVWQQAEVNALQINIRSGV